MNRESGKLVIKKHGGLSTTDSFWNILKVENFDKKTYKDLVVGNWELNRRLKASINQPITPLYINGFDEYGCPKSLITYCYEGKQTLFADNDELLKKLHCLNKKYLSYIAFDEVKLTALISGVKSTNARKMQVFEIALCYFENISCTLKKRSLRLLTQLSIGKDILCDDFNEGSLLDFVFLRTYIQIKTQLGCADSSNCELQFNDKYGFFNMENPVLKISGQSE